RHRYVVELVVILSARQPSAEKPVYNCRMSFWKKYLPVCRPELAAWPDVYFPLCVSWLAFVHAFVGPGFYYIYFCDFCGYHVFFFPLSIPPFLSHAKRNLAEGFFHRPILFKVEY